MSMLGLRPLTLAVATFGLVALAGAVQAAPAASPAATTVAAPTPPAPPTPAPKGSNEAKPRMWAVNLSSMVVYENGSGYLYGFFRDFGSATDVPARLYWGRGCPEISDRVYHILQTGFSRQSDFFLIVDRQPDPRQAGAFCVRGVELEARGTLTTPIPSPSPAPPPRPTAPVAGPGPAPGTPGTGTPGTGTPGK